MDTLYQLVVAVFLFIFFGNLVMNLRMLRRPREDAPLPDPAPLVSILIPARNEEVNIGNCLESLLAQDYPNFEIIVLDDNSVDRTAEIVREVMAKDGRVREGRAGAADKGQASAPGLGGEALRLLPASPGGAWRLVPVCGCGYGT